MAKILIVGSGASGVHFALTALDKGHEVTMLDVGYPQPEPPLAAATFDELKERLDDPVGYFLGTSAETVVYPNADAKYYGFPPSKGYVFAAPAEFSARGTGFEPLISFAQGGLAEAWTGGVYAFNDDDLGDFPLEYGALEPYYQEVARRIGISAARDDIAQFSPFDENYLEPLRLDTHAQRLLDRYAIRRDHLNQRLEFYMGRSRVATLSRDHRGREACDYLGRCLWGCPRGSIYAPSATLGELHTRAGFRYLPGFLAEHFSYEPSGRVNALVAASLEDGQRHSFTADRYVLAAGTLCTSKILLDSIYRNTGRLERLHGLMDNRQIMMPFVNGGLLGHPVDTATYQFHQLALGIRADPARAYAHGQITTLKASAVHPIIQNIPLDFRASLRLFRKAHAALGVANVWLHDERRSDNFVTIRPVEGTDRTELVIRYATEPPGETQRLVDVQRTLRRALRQLGCFVPPGMTRVLPRGASVHYAGTLPMAAHPTPLACSPSCQSYDFENLYLVDGAVLPFLPAKNLTFTLMANAARVADVMP
jgi:choline dehydrogenase-like flavoprotein